MSNAPRKGSGGGRVRLSQITGSPTFRANAINTVAVIPLLSSDSKGQEIPTTYSAKSFDDFFSSLRKHDDTIRNINHGVDDKQKHFGLSTTSNEPITIVIPNSNLTRPGQWKYTETPLRNFHWSFGCQRLKFFDGRPYHSRLAHDRLINHELTRNWIDLCPSRRTGSLIGILNVRDCPDQATLEHAMQEWHQWAERYSTPPYEVTAHGRNVERDTVVPRLFIFDSFHDSFVTNPNVDLQKATQKLKNDSLVAFPPVDEDRSQIMELHVNVVLNDLAVAIFQQLEEKIRESDALVEDSSSVKGFFGRSNDSSDNSNKGEECPRGSGDLSIENLAAVVGPNSKLTTTRDSGFQKNNNDRTRIAPITVKLDNDGAKSNEKLTSKSIGGRTLSAVKAQLLTPLDEFWNYFELSPKDAHDMMKREVARREKFAADLSLLAGSPLDAYERYTKAADLCKTISPDPLWYASALEGCAAAHIAMADIGGFNVDEYLESSFQLPEDMMACALVTAPGAKANNNNNNSKNKNKRNMPQIVMALCEDALDVTSRHQKLACFHSELLLKMAWYTAEVEDVEMLCKWGLGDAECYGGDPNKDKRRWEIASATQLNFLELKNKDGENVVTVNTYKRCQKCIELLHMAAATARLDLVTRADICLCCVSICWRGLWPTMNPTYQGRIGDRIQFKRKASFFAVSAAEAMSDVHEYEIPNQKQKATILWIEASKMLSQKANKLVGGNYGWANLRAVILHALVLQGGQEDIEKSAMELLMLLSTISPKDNEMSSPTRRTGKESNKIPTGSSSSRSDSYLESIADARSYLRESAKVVAKDARARSKELFSQQNEISSLLAVQSKWVDDLPFTPSLIPMGDYSSDFSHRVLALSAVWSAIRFENCSLAQEQLLQQIKQLRKNSPVSTLQTIDSLKSSQSLPVKITSIDIVRPKSSTKLERVQRKKKTERKDHSMATFFNPYANKKEVITRVTIPRGEEQYISITFTNKLSVPFDIASCELKFDTLYNDRIKAPSISFVIPAQCKRFTVQFPFIILEKLNDDDDDTKEEDLEVQGLFIEALSRSIFLPLGEKIRKQCVTTKGQMIPNSSSLYPRRNYFKVAEFMNQRKNVIDSPKLEVVPPQPNLRIFFASSPTSIEDETTIPVLLADGEIFTLPKICVFNDTGLRGLGKIEELQISATGLPKLPSVELYRLSANNSERKALDKHIETDASHPISISASCVGIDLNKLNYVQDDNCSRSFIAAKLFAAPGLGTYSKQCKAILRFRYRGRSVSPTLEVWRNVEVEIRILRVKGPKILSLSFRCDPSWNSEYTQLCNAFAAQESHRWYESTCSYNIDPPHAGSTDDEGLVSNQLGKDPSIYVCGDKVTVLMSVTNETTSPIFLSKEDGASLGFPESMMSQLKVSPGVSAKIPIMLKRILRTDIETGDDCICRKVIAMTRLKWVSDISVAESDDAQETGGPYFPVNRRVREGILEIPLLCLKKVIEESHTFVSRICQAPCYISINAAAGQAEGSYLTNVEVDTPVDISVKVEMAKWFSNDLLERTRCTLNFSCVRQDISLKGDNHLERACKSDHIWVGQIRKAYRENNLKNTRCRLLFLNEGDYCVSACLTLSRLNNGKDVQEVWWAEKAVVIHASKRSKTCH